MTKRDRVLKILHGEIPDRLPWFGDLSYWIDYLKATNNYPKDYMGELGDFRLYESLGGKARTTLRFFREIKAAAETDMLEDNKKQIPAEKNELKLELRPFEIKTIRVKF